MHNSSQCSISHSQSTLLLF
uniref:Uncharacterized protein n=1 Tax=Arundo donax TaxID=35708 RepID=A0A0A9FFW2_ARUDO